MFHRLSIDQQAVQKRNAAGRAYSRAYLHWTLEDRSRWLAVAARLHQQADALTVRANEKKGDDRRASLAATAGGL